MKTILFTVLILCAGTQLAYAYIGPGLGVGVIATVLGILGSIILAVFAVVWYPLKRLFKKIWRTWNAGDR